MQYISSGQHTRTCVTTFIQNVNGVSRFVIQNIQPASDDCVVCVESKRPRKMAATAASALPKQNGGGTSTKSVKLLRRVWAPGIAHSKGLTTRVARRKRVLFSIWAGPDTPNEFHKSQPAPQMPKQYATL